MALESITALEDLATKAENAVERIDRLDLGSQHAKLPRRPVPLTLAAALEWVDAIEESCRKPRIAESRRLLKDNGVKTTSIPASALEENELISRLVSIARELPAELHGAAFRGLGAALTKGCDEAEELIDSFVDAADELSALDDPTEGREWVFALAAEAVSSDHSRAAEIVAEASEVCELIESAESSGVIAASFEALDRAKEALGRFCETRDEFEATCREEGIGQDRGDSIAGKSIGPAIESLKAATAGLRSERNQLENEQANVLRQLLVFGGEQPEPASTLAELRMTVPHLKRELVKRRSKLKETLGEGVFDVVEVLSRGTVPSVGDVSDSELGAALRRAVDCGYQISLEPPDENQ